MAGLAPADLPPGSILPGRMEAVSFEAGGRRLLSEIELTIEAGPPTVILGPNGAGKSLLLRLLHGLVQPTSGRIVWQRRKQRGMGKAPRRQAMVFQRPVLLRRSVLANVDYALALSRLPSAERRRRAVEALERCGLLQLARQPARTLSGGEQQRLALARAWALRPQVLFLDEPTASLDPAGTRAVEEIVRKVAEGGTKIVMTTHDLGQARRIAGEIVFLHGGRLRLKQPAGEFFTSPASPEARAFLAGELLW